MTAKEVTERSLRQITFGFQKLAEQLFSLSRTSGEDEDLFIDLFLPSTSSHCLKSSNRTGLGDNSRLMPFHLQGVRNILFSVRLSVWKATLGRRHPDGLKVQPRKFAADSWVVDDTGKRVGRLPFVALAINTSCMKGKIQNGHVRKREASLFAHGSPDSKVIESLIRDGEPWSQMEVKE